jgi:hypothetical protein
MHCFSAFWFGTRTVRFVSRNPSADSRVDARADTHRCGVAYGATQSCSLWISIRREQAASLVWGRACVAENMETSERRYAIGGAAAMARYFEVMAGEIGEKTHCEQNGIDQVSRVS